MRTDARWLVAFAGSAFFLWLIQQLNHHLTDLPFLFGAGSMRVWLMGLPVAFLSLRLSLGYALSAGVLLALFVEATLPVPSGVLLLTTVLVICTTIAFRGTFNRLDATSALLTALVSNLAYFVVLTIALPPGDGAAAGMRLGIDLLASQGLLIALCGWFFAWQLALMRLFGFDLDTELRETL